MPSEARRRLVQLIAFVIALPLGLIVLWFVIVEYQEWRYERPWKRVTRGDSEEQVVALLGHPHRIGSDHTAKAAWESEHKIDWYNAECVKQFCYLPFSITGEEYCVGFDSSGHAASKYHVTSP
jgi:hypothetical protein